VTLLAKPHAGPLLARFAPAVKHLPFSAPWTAFRGKYRLQRWPWAELARICRELREQAFDAAASARADPRDHALLALAGARRRTGFPRRGSGLLLTDRLPRPAHPHRFEHWKRLSAALGYALPDEPPLNRPGRHVVIHTGAGHPVRLWPRARFEELATRLRTAGWRVTLIHDETAGDLRTLLSLLDSADRFIGNDSGPGHLAALLGVPTFTIFGPQLPELFAPVHPAAAWIEGGPCPYKPCFDACRFAAPHCTLAHDADQVWTRIKPWVNRIGVR
jgi:ADP-heptose:LPS heptosyltransferase